MQTAKKDNLEYIKKGEETPFETFLRYTNQKEKSAEELAKVINLIPNTDILDVGAGDGKYLELVLSHTNNSGAKRLTLLEPSIDLIRKLETRFSKHNAKIINSVINEFSTNEKYDLVLASHMFYDIPRAEWTKQFLRLSSFLKPGGKLIVVLRQKDDIYKFKTMFKAQLFKDFKALTIADVLASLPKSMRLTSQSSARSNLIFPLKKSPNDTVSIIEFLLGKQWSDIPGDLQQEILRFIESKETVFKQLDGIAVIETYD